MQLIPSRSAAPLSSLTLFLLLCCHMTSTLSQKAVPAGSHVRLNLQTGQREVRLGEEQLKYLDQEHRETEETSISPEELKRVMKKIKEDMKPESAEHQDSVASRFRPMEELKREMAELDLLVQTDDQVDNAQNLCSMGGLQLVVETLNSSDFRLQESSAFVLGSAVSSNPEVQVKAMEGGALQTLLTMLATDQPLWVKKKVLFAVASLLRNFPFAQRHFLSRGGLQVLSELFRGDRGGVLRTRIVTMLYDMISEKELISQAGLDPGLHASHQELLRQYSLVSLREGLLEEGWCSLIPELLDSTEHDFREKALRAMLALAPVCVDQYRSHSSLKASLLLLREQYQDMIQSQMILGEENEYFEEMMDLINALHVKLR
ncbi:Nucleotide exchange factor SIL1 [Dissostichus eleginoides]|uniref:Nucleotide exchange factor SIL1 n=1 Tax=Dissostichus eleginoides TaxID=100907 RepID=A0AAD9CL21_DISEL|nr:Nucleotide exchange factor SIL1 [Dissostichus eleginoides]